MNKEYTEGYDGFFKGEFYSDNPYPFDTQKHRDWRGGCYKAYHDDLNNRKEHVVLNKYDISINGIFVKQVQVTSMIIALKKATTLIMRNTDSVHIQKV